MVFAQQSEKDVNFKTLITETSMEVAFNKTMEYLEGNGYFILSLDKQAGFIQAKIFIENKKILSAKAGERRTLNFRIKPIKEGQTKVSLNVYIEEQYWGGEPTRVVYYYQEKGISKDESLYKSILDELEKNLSKE